MKQLVPMDEYGVFADSNEVARVDSLSIAGFFEKRHDHVLRDIVKITGPKSGLSEDFIKTNFAESFYRDTTGRKLLCYQMTRDGFTVLVMGYTGAKAMRFKELYIKRFNEMEHEDKREEEIIDSLGRKQTAIFINESGLYSLLFSMQPQKANNYGQSNAYPIEIQERIDKLHKFKRWVTSEVLPAIRKHGFYMTPEVAEQSEGFLKAKAQKERSEAMLLNAKARMLKTLCSVGIGGQQLSDVSKQVLGIKLAEEITGEDMGRYLPECEETYSATQIGKMFGISASRVRRIANANGLKTPEYGIRVMDKSRHSGKEGISFRYNQAAVERFQEILQDFETMW